MGQGEVGVVSSRAAQRSVEARSLPRQKLKMETTRKIKTLLRLGKVKRNAKAE